MLFTIRRLIEPEMKLGLAGNSLSERRGLYTVPVDIARKDFVMTDEVVGMARSFRSIGRQPDPSKEVRAAGGRLRDLNEEYQSGLTPAATDST